MPTNPTTELKEANRRARQILADLKDLLRESEYIRRNKYRFHYAVDSSEVYTYLFPSPDDNILSDIFRDNQLENFAYSDYCLSEILSKKRLNRAITKFHANEVRSLFERHFVELSRIDSVQGFGDLEETARNELSHFKSGPADQVIQIGEDGSEQIVTDDKLLATMRVLSPNIYVILMEQVTNRSERKNLVTSLLKTHDAISPNVAENFNKPCFDFFLTTLNRFRPGRIHQNMNDAATIEAIISYNHVKKPNFEHVRLISRDRSIYRSYSFFLNEDGHNRFYGSRQDVDLHLVRHPRTFIWSSERHVIAGASARELERLRSALERFVTDASETVDEEYLDHVSWSSWAVASLNRNFKEISRQIGNSINSSLTQDVMEESVLKSYKSELIFLLKKLYKGRSFEAELTKLGKKITKDFLDAHNDIMFWSSNLAPPQVSGGWKAVPSSDAVTIRYDLPFFPYEFKFRDGYFVRERERNSHGQGQANGGENEGMVAENELLLGYIYEHSSQPSSACERRMAMSLQQAIRGDWEGAIYYSRLATTVPRLMGLDRSEAFYLNSILTRRNSVDIPSLESAVDSAKQAIGSEHAGKKDARFHREYAAALLAVLQQKYVQDGPIVLEEKQREADAFRILEVAIKLYSKEPVGVAHCYRIACSYFLDSKGRRDEELAIEYAGRLKIHMEEHDIDLNLMSYRFCDTLLAVYKSRQWKARFEDQVLSKMSNLEPKLVSPKDLSVFSARRFYPREILVGFKEDRSSYISKP